MSEVLEEISIEERNRRLEPFLRQCLHHQTYTLVESKATNLLLPGENNCSVMVKLDVTVRKHGDTEEQKLYLAAKTNSRYQKPFLNWPKSFEKESFVHTELLPTYRDIEREAGFEETELIDTLPKYYGTKYAVRGESKNPDEDLAILMDNLLMKGYYRVKRHQAFDVEHATKAISTLARFHALGIVMKQKRPNFAKIATKNFHYDPYHPIAYDKGVEAMSKVFGKVPRLAKYEYFLKSSMESYKTMLYSEAFVPDEPWASINHGDFWIINILFHKDEAGKVDDVKFVDYKSSVYASPLMDLPYFLCSSLDESTTNDRFEDLLDLHHGTFVRTLERFGVDVAPYSRESFDEELKRQAHVIFALTVLVIRFVAFDGEKEKEKDKDHLESVIHGKGSEVFIKKLLKLIEIYERKGWF